MTAPALSYDVVDVFAEGPFAGNQLAVVHGASGLPDAALQAIAQEFGYSETTFPEPVDGGRYRVRIFTPGGEIPFAGHPTLGTAWVLRDRGLLAGESAVQECAAGPVDVGFGDDVVELSAVPRDLVGPLEDAVVDALLVELGLEPADRDGDAWLAGAGLTFVHLPVRPDALARAVLGRRPVEEVAALPPCTDPVGGINVHVVAEGAGHVAVRSRVFVPGLLGAEDPATGSSAAGLGLALHARGLLASGTFRITQGVEMGRPSALAGSVAVEDGAVTRVRVAGQVHPIARGEIRAP